VKVAPALAAGLTLAVAAAACSSRLGGQRAGTVIGARVTRAWPTYCAAVGGTRARSGV